MVSYCGGGDTAGGLILRSRSFTLVETIIVLLIATMIFGLVVPRIGRLPARVAIRKSTSELILPFVTAARRARATGTEVTLLLDLAEHRADIRAGGTAPMAMRQSSDDEASEGQDERTPDSRFRIPADIEWSVAEDSPVQYRFFPTGEGSGPELEFRLRGRTFIFSVDGLTGRPSVEEVGE